MQEAFDFREPSPAERGEHLDPYPGCPGACAACGAPRGHWSEWFHVAPSPWVPAGDQTLAGAWPYNPHGVSAPADSSA